jgi:serine/threonine protein kinase
MGRDDDANVPLAEQVDAAADRFEAAWKVALAARGGSPPVPPPVIEDYLGDVGPAGRVALLRELIALDRAYRDGAGITPTSGGAGANVLAEQVDAVADRFEAAWKTALAATGDGAPSGPLPTIEDFVGGLGEAHRIALLRELIPLDQAYRDRAGITPAAGDAGADVPLAELVDAAADRFEAAWKAALPAGGGAPPVIEDFVAGLGGAHRVALLRELVSLDRAYRARAGVAPRSGGGDDYAGRFPDWAAAVRPGPTVTAPALRRPSEVDLVNAALRPPGGGPPRYVAVEKLGEGGMGSVFKAEQRAARPGDLRRRDVALKLVPLGMNSQQVLARFEAEWQALALMNHPNIATVFDAGLLADGRPYFAMEHVPGRPITTFADHHRLSIEQRLRLFEQVCDAVQHAHGKAVLHRDLKPSNVLAYMDGTTPRVKVIDFGLAKAMGGRLTDATLHTHVEQVLGTWAYMSPEQAAGDPDIDVRTDVYALGVILYELLAGANPFDFKRLAELEIRRVIRETDPPRPDTRLSRLGAERASEVSKSRGVPVAELRARLAGELGWIPLEALKKSRAERYETVPALRADVDRYLTARPLKAGPDSAAYRLRKFARRNRGPVAAAVLLLGTLAATVGFIRASAGLVRASVERDRAQTTSVLLQEILGSVGRRVTATDVDRMARRFDQSRASLDPEVAAVVCTGLANLYRSLGLYDEAETRLKTALDMRERLGGKDHLDLQTAAALHEVADLLRAKPAPRTRDADEDDARAASILAARARALGLDVGDVPRPLLGPAIQIALHTEAIERSPREPQLLSDRAALYARLARFGHAADDYRRAIDANPDEHWSWFYAAFLSLELGDEEGYRARCKGMLDRFEKTTDAGIAERTAKACFAGSLPADLRDRAMALLDTHVPAAARPWLDTARGMGQYRRGDYAAAVSSLRAGKDDLDPPAARAAAEFFLAMACYRQSDTSEAEDAWRRGLKLATALPHAGIGDLDNFENWILCHAAGREAATVLGKDYPIEKPAPR